MTGPVLGVDGYTVRFPVGWAAGKFDDWVFYNKQFSRIRDGLKAVDVVAVCPEKVAYLIEFKDYRGRRRDKAGTIDAEFIGKALSTLSALLPARCNALDAGESAFATRVLGAAKIRLVLHLDQSKPGNKLYPPVADAANLTQKLRGKLASIDRRLKVCSSDSMAGVPWTVS